MNAETLDFCQKEIADLLAKNDDGIPVLNDGKQLPDGVNTLIYTIIKHFVGTPSERKIPTKARPIQMNAETLDFCQKEIADLLAKNIICKSKSPWSCAAFYVILLRFYQTFSNLVSVFLNHPNIISKKKKILSVFTILNIFQKNHIPKRALRVLGPYC
jgi:hypothetical protein